ncbi:ABC transporter permease [Candidatus Saccharibacteria bacterium]|nr:ABC transporter permease [Candidatus Saccharibacteria bacterium]
MKLSNIFSRKNRILLAELVRTDFKLRYQASALGYLWSILNPLFLFAILYVVFDKFLGLGRDIEHFPVYLLLGIVLWRFFTEATTNGLKAIVQRGSLIRKISFPRYIIVLSGTISSLINLFINLGVVLVFVFINGVELTWSALLIIPLIIELYIFALAIAFFLSAVNVFFRDISYLWDIFIQGAFYATPIIYPLSLVANQSQLAAQLLLLNPVAQVMQDVRYVFITRDTQTLWQLALAPWVIAVPFLIIITMCIVAIIYFRRQSKRFAEYV